MFVKPTHEEIGTRTFHDGRKVRKRFGDEVKIVDGDGLLYKNYSPLVFFFGAYWDENSRKCIPYIRDFYEKIKEKGNDFNVLYVSSDDNVEELTKFMLELPEDFIALYGKYYDDNDEESQLAWFFRKRYFIKSIPIMFFEFGMHPVYYPKREGSFDLVDYGVYRGGRTSALTDIIEFGEDAWELWKLPTDDDDRSEEEQNYRLEWHYKAMLMKHDYRLNKHSLRTEYTEITRHPVWEPTKSPLDMFDGLTLLRKKGDEFVYETPEEALQDIDVIGLYFSAEDFETCHTTIRYLPRCYRKWKANGEPFEVVYFSKDKSKEQMESYMKLMHGDWLAVPFEEDWDTRLGGSVYFPQHPALVIVNKSGELITRNGALDISVEEVDSIDYWKQGIPVISREEFIEKDAENEKKEIYKNMEESKKEKETPKDEDDTTDNNEERIETDEKVD